MLRPLLCPVAGDFREGSALTALKSLMCLPLAPQTLKALFQKKKKKKIANLFFNFDIVYFNVLFVCFSTQGSPV
jgi:hypothetical protein